MKNICMGLMAALLPLFVAAQPSTLSAVSTIFQANCTVGCHSGASPSANLDLTGTGSALVNALVNVDPVNPAALNKGYKLVDPGYPHNSFLLYKCAYTAWDDAFQMDIAEGSTMPQNQSVLDKEEVELIRQWILYGAPQSGQVVSPQTLYDYYHVNGMARIAKPVAPAPGEGFQMHMGPFFLEPGEEVEFYKKEKANNSQLENVIRFEAFFNDESHHFLLFEFIPGTEDNVEEGLRPVTVQNAFQDAEYMVGWVDPDVTSLPAGTAYKVDQNGTLDLNYHLINYASNGDSVLAAEAYINYYTDNTTPNLIEMFSDLLINLNIFIFNNGQEYTFTDPVFTQGANPNDSMYVWFLSSHTHKYGTDYDIYKRNPDGTKGQQLYEGFYNTTYTFNQGYYDWEHPGNLYLDQVYGELMPIALKDGLIQEAKYQINNPNETAPLINFGLTTNDEMMLSFIQYTLQRVPEAPNGVGESAKVADFMSIYPNPTEGNAVIRFAVDAQSTVDLTVFNSLGQKVQTVYSGTIAAGQATFNVDLAGENDPSGIYLVRLVLNDQVYTSRLIQTR